MKWLYRYKVTESSVVQYGPEAQWNPCLMSLCEHGFECLTEVKLKWRTEVMRPGLQKLNVKWKKHLNYKTSNVNSSTQKAGQWTLTYVMERHTDTWKQTGLKHVYILKIMNFLKHFSFVGAQNCINFLMYK